MGFSQSHKWPTAAVVHRTELDNCNSSPELHKLVTNSLDRLELVSVGILPFTQNVYLCRSHMLYQLTRVANIDIKVTYWMDGVRELLNIDEAIPVLCTYYWNKFMDVEYERIRLMVAGAVSLQAISAVQIVIGNPGEYNFKSIGTKALIMFDRNLFRNELETMLSRNKVGSVEDRFVLMIKQGINAELITTFIILAFSDKGLWADLNAIPFSHQNIHEFENMLTPIALSPLMERDIRKTSMGAGSTFNLRLRVEDRAIYLIMLLERSTIRIWTTKISAFPLILCNNVLGKYKNLDFLVDHINKRDESIKAGHDSALLLKNTMGSPKNTSIAGVYLKYKKFKYIGDNALYGLIFGTNLVQQFYENEYFAPEEINAKPVDMIEDYPQAFRKVFGDVYMKPPTMQSGTTGSTIVDIDGILGVFNATVRNVTDFGDLVIKTRAYIKEVTYTGRSGDFTWGTLVTMTNFLTSSFKSTLGIPSDDAINGSDGNSWLKSKGAGAIKTSFASAISTKAGLESIRHNYGYSLLNLAKGKDSNSLYASVFATLAASYTLTFYIARTSWIRNPVGIANMAILISMFPSVEEVRNMAVVFIREGITVLNSIDPTVITNTISVQIFPPPKNNKKDGKAGRGRGGRGRGK